MVRRVMMSRRDVTLPADAPRGAPEQVCMHSGRVQLNGANSYKVTAAAICLSGVVKGGCLALMSCTLY